MLNTPVTTDSRTEVVFTPRDPGAAKYVDGALARLLPVIVKALDPLEIWLFGSRAEGRAGNDSDYDLLVVVPDGAPAAAFDPRAAFMLAADSDVKADVVPVTMSEFNADKELLDTLPRAAWLRGRCLYERRDSHRRLPQDR